MIFLSINKGEGVYFKKFRSEKECLKFCRKLVKKRDKDKKLSVSFKNVKS